MKGGHQIINATTEDLLESYRSTHHNKYVGELYQRFIPLVLGVSMKYLKNEADAQDAVIDIFEKVSEVLKGQAVIHFKSWLYMVVKNHCLMKLRGEQAILKKQREFKESMRPDMELSMNLHHNNIDTPDKEKRLVMLEACIENLELSQKICVELFFLKEKSYQEVEELTDLNYNKVKSYIQNGKRNLKKCMEEKMRVS